MQESAVPGMQPGMPALALVNTPLRAVRSSRWSGLNLDWRHAPDEYAAMYFHADALTECGWQVGISVRIPPGTKSGVYGLEVAHRTEGRRVGKEGVKRCRSRGVPYEKKKIK